MGFNFLEELYVFSSKSNYVPREMYEQQKALADKRLELLKEVLDQVFPHPDTWNEIFCEELIDRLTKELADG